MPVAIPIAMVVAAGVTAVAAKYNADQQAAAAGNALGAEEKGATSADQALIDARNNGQTAMQPYINQGTSAMNQLASRQNFNFGATDPSYKFRQQEGQNAVEASAASKGGYFSGATGTALQTQGQNLASEEYQNEYNRWMQQNQFLQNQVQAGEQASSYASGLGYNTGQSLAGISTGLGNAQASTITNQANTAAQNVQSNVSNSVNLGGSLLSYYSLQNLLANGNGGTGSSAMGATNMYGQDTVAQNNNLIDNMQSPSLTYGSGGY